MSRSNTRNVLGEHPSDTLGPECRRQGVVAIPIGIGMPIREEGIARMIHENHLARRSSQWHTVSADRA